MNEFSSSPFPENFDAGDDVWQNLDFAESMSDGPSDKAAEATRLARAAMDHIRNILEPDGQADRMEDKPTPSSRPVMSEISREELDAKLEIIELRMDSRVASIEGRCAGIESKIDSFIAVQQEQMRFNEHRFESYEKGFGEMRTEIKSLKTTIVVTAISTVLAIVIGVASFNAALTSNMMGAFQAGKEIKSPPPAIPVGK